MEVNEKYSVGLVVVSLIVLANAYSYIDLSALSLSKFGVGLTSKAIKDGAVLDYLVVALIVGLTYAHIRIYSNVLSAGFVNGYRNCRIVVKEVALPIREETGTKAHGSPVANIKPNLFKRTFSFGSFSKQNGSFTKNMSITLSMGAHIIGLVSGACSVIRHNSFSVAPFCAK